MITRQTRRFDAISSHSPHLLNFTSGNTCFSTAIRASQRKLLIVSIMTCCIVGLLFDQETRNKQKGKHLIANEFERVVCASYLESKGRGFNFQQKLFSRCNVF